MKLVKLTIRNYRSIKDQTNNESIHLNSLSCLVGKNDAGKSNVLRAIIYLLGKERYRDFQEDLHFNRDDERKIEVCGYFEVEDKDFERLKIKEKREVVKDQVLPDGTFGIYRDSDDQELKVLGLYPKEKRLQPNEYSKELNKIWKGKKSKNDFKQRMKDKFPEIFPYLEQGKETNKGAWEKAYDELIREQPSNLDYIEIPRSPKQGIPADLLNLLPELIIIPAVKELSDATRTSSRAELGSLLSAVSEQIEEELDEAIDEALSVVSRRLNVVLDPDTKETTDERHESVKSLESRITRYVKETFSAHSIELEFPNPSSQTLFNQAQLWVREEGFDERILVENVGEGVKRILIFSLIRTLADLRQGKLSINSEDGESAEKINKPLLILYEEAELFLHPSLQTILLKSLLTLSDDDGQVIYSTHSPFMIPIPDDEIIINQVVKTTEHGTKLSNLGSVINKLGERRQRQIFEIQHLSKYIFTSKAVLVEGASDLIILKKIAPKLSKNWDFDFNEIPILPVGSRDTLPLFYSFLSDLDIRPFVMMDLDAVRNTIDNFDIEDQVLEQSRKELLNNAGQLIEKGEYEDGPNRDEAESIVWECTWSDLFDRLNDVKEKITNKEEMSDDDAQAITRLLNLQTKKNTEKAISSDNNEVAKHRNQLRKVLLNHDVLLLDSEIEDYYPYPGGNKIEAALNFNPEGYTQDELISNYFKKVDGMEKTDIEVFLARIFNDT